MKIKLSIFVIAISIIAMLFVACDSGENAIKETATPTTAPTTVATEVPTPTNTPEPTATPEPAEVYDKPDYMSHIGLEVEGFQDEQTEYHPPEDMVDGDTSTRWSYNSFPTDILFDFGAPWVMNKADITWASGSNRSYFYEIYISLDGVNYELLIDRNDNEDVGLTTDALTGKLARFVKITLINNSIANGWASVQEVFIEAFRFGKTSYNVDYSNKKIEITGAVAKEAFIENCKLGGIFEASVEKKGTSENIETGDKLVIKCGETEYKYEITVK